MKVAIYTVSWTIFGLIGLETALAGNFAGWLCVLAAVWSIVATFSSRSRCDKAKEERSGNGVGSHWDVGGCDGGGWCGGSGR